MRVLLLVLFITVSASAQPSPVAAIAEAVASNDWPRVTNLYVSIDWPTLIDPQQTLRQLSEEMKGLPQLRELRREIKTKYVLLMEAGEDAITDPVTVLPVPVVETSCRATPALALPMTALFRLLIPYSPLSIAITPVWEMPMAATPFAATPVWVTPSTPIFTALDILDLWRSRYALRADMDVTNRISPARGTVLWDARRGLSLASEVDYDAKLAAYNDSLNQAMERRALLHKKRRIR